jgi:hypothetical protein
VKCSGCPVDANDRIRQSQCSPCPFRNAPSPTDRQPEVAQGRSTESLPLLHVLDVQMVHRSISPDFDPGRLAGRPGDGDNVRPTRPNNGNAVTIADATAHQVGDTAQLQKGNEAQPGFGCQRPHPTGLPEKDGECTLARRGWEP